MTPSAPVATPRSRFAACRLSVLVLAFATGYAWMAWQRYATFHSGIDMSYYLRLVWGLANGHYDLPLVGASNILGLHLEPILLPFAVLHALGVPLVPLLLLTQSVAVALLAVPAYRLAARHLASPWAGLAGAILAFLYPTVTVAALHDFHPITLALPLLLGVVDALDEGKVKRALVLGALALACREDVALQLACLTWAWAVARHGRVRLLALGLTAGLVAYFCGYVFAIQPWFVPSSGSFTLHFTAFGGAEIHSGLDLLRFALAQPLAFFSSLATMDRLLYLPVLLWPLGCLGLLAPRYLVGALPIIAINLLSDFPRVRTIEAHYATAIAPLVIGASLVGVGALRRFVERHTHRRSARQVNLAILCACFALSTVAQVEHGGSPLALRSPKWLATGLFPPSNAAQIRTEIETIPPTASVAAPVGVLSHLTQRPRAICPPDYTDGQPVEYTFPVIPMPLKQDP